MGRFFILSATLGILIWAGVGNATTLTVDPGGTGDYLTISDAVVAAVAGDTILVGDGSYGEDVTVDKAVTVMSVSGSGSVTLTGTASNKNVLTVTVDGVALQGLTVTGGRTGVVVDGAVSDLAVMDLVIEETGSYQVAMGPNLPPVVLPGMTLIGHASGKYDAVQIVSGTISESLTWPSLPAGFVYLQSSTTVTVKGPSGPVLTIPSGAIIKSFFSRFEIASATEPGGLMADGVIFTSFYDDEGGDTNGTGAQPAGGNWQRLDFNAMARADSSMIINCDLRYGGQSSRGVIEVAGSDPVVSGCTFLENSSVLRVENSPSLGANQTGNTIIQGPGRPIITDLDHLQNLVFGNTITPRGDSRWNGIEILSSTVTQSRTLPVLPHGFSYYLSSAVITVKGSAGPVLTIPSGTIIKNFFSRIEVASATEPGGLMADGVIFTSVYDDEGGDTNGSPTAPAGGNWQRLDFNAMARADSSMIINCDLRYGGQSSRGVIEVAGSDPVVSGCTFLENSSVLRVENSPSLGANQTGNTINQGPGLPIITDLDHLQNLVFGNTINPRGDNRWNGIEILSSTVAQSRTLPVLPHGFVYYLASTTITVTGPSGPVLSIPSGTIIKSFFSGFEIASATEPGGLMADGVIFTSIYDDEGGDTNGTGAQPAGGNWSRLDFNAMARADSSRITNCEVRYAGSPAIEANGARPYLDSCLIRNSSGAGLRATGAGAEPTVKFCTFQDNTVGIEALNGGYFNVIRSCFSGNTDFGVTVDAPGGDHGTYLARNCWWGDPSGPSGFGPGAGDAISDHVDFTSWYTSEACLDLPSDTPDRSVVPSVLVLEDAYPNPFNPTTTLAFSLPETGPTQVGIYTLDGRLVHTLVSGTLPAGRHTLVWRGDDEGGRPVAAGLYLYRVIAGSQQQVGKLMLVK